MVKDYANNLKERFKIKLFKFVNIIQFLNIVFNFNLLN